MDTTPLRPARTVALAFRRLAVAMDAALEEFGLGFDQWLTLDLLSHGSRSMGQLCEELGLSAPTATRLMDALVDKGLAYRLSSPQDRRKVLAALSDMGADVLARAESTAAGVERDQNERARSPKRVGQFEPTR